MKRYKHLWDEFISMENLELAAKKQLSLRNQDGNPASLKQIRKISCFNYNKC